MDSEKGALLAWLGLVFMRRGALGAQVPKPWLPDLPHLGRVLQNSNNFEITSQCNGEIRMLGRTANFTFTDFLTNYHTPIQPFGSSAANRIVVDDYTDATFVLDSSLLSLCYTAQSSWCSEAVSQGAQSDEDVVVNKVCDPSCSAGACTRSSPRGSDVLDEMAIERLVLADMAEELSPRDVVEAEFRGAVTHPRHSEDASSNLSDLLANVTLDPSTNLDSIGQSSDGYGSDSHMYSPPHRA
ncbi:hypothetical protein KC19_VG165600 [Ceratodon purpureus]|uniref:Uncharacterized protein n=1 Tax=Ceratodon purpureus TaxID=3225 RepID=A0A8T0HQP0_CERPU|nr:hypothetical protein KC19_VG165600 [Ceratodon purpureus]